MLRVKATAIATICLSIIGCGGGSSDPDSTMPTDTNNDVLTGIFVDSAVEGISYSTATQSDITNAQGQFNYMAGEQVTFSIGATQLPTVTAAAQVSPVDMAAGSANPTATTTNIARLLQSLDSDGNPNNGITISPSAAANAATINFDVSVDDFANNTNVINLVANSGSVNSSLISAEDANTHLNDTLGNTAETNNDGLWIRNPASSTESGLVDYSFVDGLNISRYNSTAAGCYTISRNTATPLGDNRYQLNADNGAIFYIAIRVGDTLEVTFDGESTLIYPRANGVDLATLPICILAAQGTFSSWLSVDAYQSEFVRQVSLDHYPVKVEGRCNNGAAEYRGEFVEQPSSTFIFWSHHSLIESDYELLRNRLLGQSYRPVNEQEFLCGGVSRFQGTWVLE